MKSCLFISREIESNILTGGNIISRRNLELLKENFDGIDFISIPSRNSKNATSKLKKFLHRLNILCNILIFHNAFMNVNLIERKLKEKLSKTFYKVIFVDQSLYGNLAEIAKKQNSQTVVVCFFHNVEYLYYKQLVNNSGFYKKPLAWSAIYNEKKAIQYADKIIALNKRDEDNIKKIYNRKVDLLLPTTLKDKFDIEKINNKNNKKCELLFVGTDFFANYHGVKWFIYSVLPCLNNVKLTIIGKGVEKWKKEFSGISNVDIIGEVEDVSYYYYKADAVIIPIFLGSGMKTKTAEALMYGKFIFGTKEAFEGYDISYNRIGAICYNEQDFINKLNMHFKRRNGRFNAFSRKVFLERYEESIIRKKFKKFSDSLEKRLEVQYRV